MEEGHHVNSYYAIVWNTSLDTNMVLRGTKITRFTKLPNDPRMLYGTNKNDVAKIKKVKLWKKIGYDPYTTKQEVKFWHEVEEYKLSRDIYIVVWEGKDRIRPSEDYYKIVTPELFEHIVALAPDCDDAEEIWIDPFEELIPEEDEVKDFKNMVQNVAEGISYHGQQDGKLTMQSLSYQIL